MRCVANTKRRDSAFCGAHLRRSFLELAATGRPTVASQSSNRAAPVASPPLQPRDWAMIGQTVEGWYYPSGGRHELSFRFRADRGGVNADRYRPFCRLSRARPCRSVVLRHRRRFGSIDLPTGRLEVSVDLAIRHALEAAGVELIDENGGRSGVRHRRRTHKRQVK
jgi:hypothetical protein